VIYRNLGLKLLYKQLATEPPRASGVILGSQLNKFPVVTVGKQEQIQPHTSSNLGHLY
jgi:hypothetical protein